MGSLDYINSKFMPKNYKNKEEVNKEYVDLVRNFLLNNQHKQIQIESITKK